MSNIYNKGLEYQILPSGKRLLQYPTKTTIPEYTIVGNTKPNLDYNVNRQLQPIFYNKKPIQQTPFLPKNPIKASGLGGRKPIDIDYVIQPRKPKQPMGLIWEPNTIREMRQNVYPDGLPKNNVPAQSADSAFIEKKHAEREIDRLESLLKYAREHPEQKLDVARLEKLKDEKSYIVNPYKNVALSVEGHRKMAEREAKGIQEELKLLREKNRENFDDLLYGIDKKMDNLEAARIEKGQKALEGPVGGEFAWLLNIKEKKEFGIAIDKIIDALQEDINEEQKENIREDLRSVREQIQDLKKYDWNEMTNEQKEQKIKELALSKTTQKKLVRIGRRFTAKKEKREMMEKIKYKKELLSELRGEVRGEEKVSGEEIILPKYDASVLKEAQMADSLYNELNVLDARRKEHKQRIKELYKQITGKERIPIGRTYSEIKKAWMKSLKPAEIKKAWMKSLKK